MTEEAYVPSDILLEAATISGRLLMLRGVGSLSGVKKLKDVDLNQCWKSWYQKQWVKAYEFDIDPVPTELDGLETPVHIMIDHYQQKLHDIVPKIHDTIFVKFRQLNMYPHFSFEEINHLGHIVYNAYNDLAIKKYYEDLKAERADPDCVNKPIDMKKALRGMPLYPGTIPPLGDDESEEE